MRKHKQIIFLRWSVWLDWRCKSGCGLGSAMLSRFCSAFATAAAAIRKPCSEACLLTHQVLHGHSQGRYHGGWPHIVLDDIPVRRFCKGWACMPSQPD
jgi:hypothetical protein